MSRQMSRGSDGVLKRGAGVMSAAMLSRVGLGVGLSVGVCSGQAIAQQQAVWVARGPSEHATLIQPSGSLTTGQLGSLFSINSGPLPDANVYSNWAIATPAGSSTGYFADSVYDVHGAIGDLLHPSRQILMSEDGLPPNVATGSAPVMRSLRIATGGDLTIIDPQLSISPNGWLIRDAQCSGTHSLTMKWFRPEDAWIGGTGSMVIEASRLHYVGDSSNTTFTKSGPGVLVFNPSPSRYEDGKVFMSICQVYDGTMVLQGAGLPYLIGASNFGDVIRIGTQYGGSTLPPTSIPVTPWTIVDLSQPPAPNPRVVIQADNVVPPGKRVRMGGTSTLRFEAPEPISFLGRVVSDTPGATMRIECAAEVLEAVTFDVASLNQFLGTLRIERGIARLQGAPNAAARFELAAPTYLHEAVLELKVPGAQYAFGNDVTGTGRVFKWGPGTLEFTSDTSGFAGDFVVHEGQLLLPPLAPAGALRNSVSVDGPTSVLNQQASHAVADNTVVSLDDSGRWLLNGRTDTISSLRLVNNARLELGGGSLTLGGGVLEVVHTPGGTSTAVIAGPGTLTSSVPLSVDLFDSLAPIDLDIQATFAGPSAVFSGLGTTRIGGSGAGGPALTLQSGVLRLNRTGVDNAAGALTIGDPSHGLPWTPDAAVVLDGHNQLPDNKAVAMNLKGLLDLNGFTDTIGGLTVSGAGPFTIQTNATGELTVGGPASFTGNGTTTISGYLNLMGGTRTFTVNTGSTVKLQSTAYAGTLSKVGAGVLRLEGVTGSMILNNAGANTTVATAEIGGLTGTSAVQVESALTVTVAGPNSLGFGGAITGAGSFTKSGPGLQELNAGAVNTYTGGTRVEGGVLFLNRFAGTNVIPGNITVADGGTLRFAGGANNQIVDTSDVTVDPLGIVEMRGQSETIRNLVLSGNWSIDNANGTPGNLNVTQSAFVLGGQLSGNMSGGAMSIINGGVADIRGTIASVNVGTSGTLAVGGKVGSDQLTITGNFSLFNSTSRLTFTTDAPTDPALIRALGTLSYPASGQSQVRVNQFVPQPIGTAIKLIDFGTGASVPNLSKYALIVPVAGSGRGKLVMNNRVLSYVVVQNPCPADANGSGTLTIDDVFVFLNEWFAGSEGADFDLSGGIAVQDIFAFLNAWFAGCP